MIANRRRPGTTSRKSSSRLPTTSADPIDSPVTLPPGRAKLATSPLSTGSTATAKTIGMTDVACFTERAEFPPVTMTSTFIRTNRSEEHTSELQSQSNLVCRLLLEKKKKKKSVYAMRQKDQVRIV